MITHDHSKALTVLYELHYNVLGTVKKAILQPTQKQLENGCIAEETRPGSNVMRGSVAGGGFVLFTLDQVVSVEPCEV